MSNKENSNKLRNRKFKKVDIEIEKENYIKDRNNENNLNNLKDHNDKNKDIDDELLVENKKSDENLKNDNDEITDSSINKNNQYEDNLNDDNDNIIGKSGNIFLQNKKKKKNSRDNNNNNNNPFIKNNKNESDLSNDFYDANENNEYIISTTSNTNYNYNSPNNNHKPNSNFSNDNNTYYQRLTQLYYIYSFVFIYTLYNDTYNIYISHQQALIRDISVSQKNYIDNQCDPELRRPAMENICEEWNRRRNQNPTHSISIIKLCLISIGQLIDAFLSTFSYKSMFLLVLFLLFWILLNSMTKLVGLPHVGQSNNNNNNNNNNLGMIR
ncbi:hypothetical protein K502DRAFT_208996 [Neoconidiobolus thromboides FSU 785]|nr:hypothetical protein K502DRAFT_208996 [Neoconidiobolus thromboides FSU 785]